MLPRRDTSRQSRRQLLLPRGDAARTSRETRPTHCLPNALAAFGFRLAILALEIEREIAHYESDKINEIKHQILFSNFLDPP
ncbi:MAG TPA: hypothetical protein VE944_15940 [Nostoc sp.]|uniref:hypothetical protein n=1 Tax=Nostoc sp. TaxID=1180 RepID=UPI002D44BC11|nr:hypothetical protein [Nostoc sp.]HYX15825.1 hypothetical protein [Nostoc sp.]